jgi:hypothetical protein
LSLAGPAAAAEVVPVSQFSSVQLRGGGAVVIRPGPVQRVTIVSGSAQFTRIRVERGRQLVIDACDTRCPQHYDLRVQIETPQAPDVAIEGGGEISAAPGFGAERELGMAISGGGVIDMRPVRASDISAAINGGGKILAGPSATLSAAVNGGGEIRYSGDPAVTSAIQGGGNVRRGD